MGINPREKLKRLMVRLDRLFPPGVSVVDELIPVVRGTVWPQEAAHVARAVKKRRDEFCAGRVLARRALAASGAHDAPLLVGVDRAPIWPSGFVGSISHTDTRVVAVAARRDRWAALGVDIEEITRFHSGLEARVLLPDEIAAYLDGLDQGARRTTTAALFCAKEAYYKCQYTLTGLRLTFHDVAVEIGPAEDRSFGWVTARRVQDSATACRGRYAVTADFAAAAFGVAADAG